jgi:HSP20 family protein
MIMAESKNVPIKREKGGAVEERREWLPFERLRQEIDHLFEDFGRGLFRFPTRSGMPQIEPSWRMIGRGIEPVVDLVEMPDSFKVTAELPGLEEKNIEVKVTNGTLVIKGEKQETKEEKNTNYVVSERRYGSYQRAFRMPEGVAADRIDATFKNGVLTVTLPKTEEARKETKISVKAA